MLSFDDQVVVITGAGNGIGTYIAKHLASAGAKVFLQDYEQKHLIKKVADKINAAGGYAVVSPEVVTNGKGAVEAAVAQAGRIDVLINNSSASLTEDWASTSTGLWDSMLERNLKDAYKSVQAAWSHFKNQKYGRILGTSSIIEGGKKSRSVLQSTALYGDLGFAQTLAREGKKYNILASTLTASQPIKDSDIDEILNAITLLVHSSNTGESGNLYHYASKNCAKFRWQRSKGVSLRPDPTMKPMTILERWNEINDFSEATYPAGSADFPAILRYNLELPPNKPVEDVRLDKKVAIVTGAGSGLGRAYAKYLASLGASVVLNDIKDPRDVAEEIKKIGGKVSVVVAPVEDGEVVVAKAIRDYGHLDIVVNNAGFVRDKSIAKMTDQLWDSVISVHLQGSFRVIKAAWPYLVRQRYGRIINISSTSGIYGNFGQANYSTAKCGIIGFSDALAREGSKHNILVNTLAPVASTPGLGAAIEGSSTNMLPEYIAPFLALMASDLAHYPLSGGLYEIGAGWHARTRQQSSRGASIEANDSKLTTGILTKIADFTKGPISLAELEGSEASGVSSNLARIDQIRQRTDRGSSFVYDTRDVVLYNLTVGAKWSELPLVYEKNHNFQALPTFGVIPFFSAKLPFTFDEIIPNWSSRKYLHGEHYLEIRRNSIPTQGKLTTFPQLLEVTDKEGATLVRIGYTTKDAIDCGDVFYNESTMFVFGASGIGGGSRRKGRYIYHRAPTREPDVSCEETTTKEQAALYRLNGDRNDLHIDPAVATQAGYPRPILHGLCFLGISGKHLYQTFGSFRSIGCRFAGMVLPGQTLRTEMWIEKSEISGPGNSIVLFQTRVLETGKLCITGGRVEMFEPIPRSRL